MRGCGIGAIVAAGECVDGRLRAGRRHFEDDPDTARSGASGAIEVAIIIAGQSARRIAAIGTAFEGVQHRVPATRCKFKYRAEAAWTTEVCRSVQVALRIRDQAALWGITVAGIAEAVEHGLFPALRNSEYDAAIIIAPAGTTDQVAGAVRYQTGIGKMAIASAHKTVKHADAALGFGRLKPARHHETQNGNQCFSGMPGHRNHANSTNAFRLLLAQPFRVWPEAAAGDRSARGRRSTVHTTSSGLLPETRLPAPRNDAAATSRQLQTGHRPVLEPQALSRGR